MSFKVGDQVIHSSFGLGEIIQLDEKEIYGHKDTYYMVQICDLTLWVPVRESGETSLRYLTPERDFKKLFKILTGPGEELPEDRLARKSQLLERLKDGRLDSVCEVVRDLNDLGRKKKLNDYDKAIMERAKSFLLNEWKLALSVPMQQAEQELRELLGGRY